MGPFAPEAGGPWRAARVRFMESGRARQTPVALDLGQGWFAVRLLGEELLAGRDRRERPRRRWRLGDQKGRVWELAGDPRGGWRARPQGGQKV